MSSARWMLFFLAAGALGLFACSSDSTTPGQLDFSVAESLLVLYPEDATQGYALLSGGTGTCAALQSGLTVAPSAQVANLNYLYILIGEFDSSGGSLPLTAATYTVIDPTVGASPPGLFALVAGIGTDDACGPTEQDANSGSVTLNPFVTEDGGTSSLNFSAVFGGTTQLTGSYSLTTCLVSLDAGVPAGTCVQCTAQADGGPCAIQ
jgi:hypothetical protein